MSGHRCHTSLFHHFFPNAASPDIFLDTIPHNTLQFILYLLLPRMPSVFSAVPQQEKRNFCYLKKKKILFQWLFSIEYPMHLKVKNYNPALIGKAKENWSMKRKWHSGECMNSISECNAKRETSQNRDKCCQHQHLEKDTQAREQ